MHIEKEKKKGWNFDNSYAHLPEIFYTKQNPALVPSPKLVVLNKVLAKSLGLDINMLESQEGLEILAGNRIPEGSLPIAQGYAGHQFGHFTMLGDGRALLLGEQITPKGERFDIQLKGSGRTPYSRGGDGKAALGPMLREYIISEAMNGLNIPTSRSLAIVTTGESIVRETILPGAILTRVASSHIRVGTFQYALAYGSAEDEAIIAELLQLMEKHGADFTNTFRGLTMNQFDGIEFFAEEEFTKWYEKWNIRLLKEDKSKEEVKQLMRENNPAVIPRNHRVEEALEAAVNKGDYSVMEKLIQVLANPYAYSSQQDEYFTLPISSIRPYRTFCGT